MDCMDGMKQFPDKYFDLAIVDPPYGIKVKNNMGRRHGAKKSDYPKAYWDKVTPPPEYFTELFRVARHSIIWGGNYFNLPPAKCFVIWDKPDKSENVTFAMCEYAWTDFDMTAKIFRRYAKDDCRIHATHSFPNSPAGVFLIYDKSILRTFLSPFRLVVCPAALLSGQIAVIHSESSQPRSAIFVRFPPSPPPFSCPAAPPAL